MSDMEKSDVTDAAPVAEPVAPDAPVEVVAAEPTPAPEAAPAEPTVEELQAEIDAEKQQLESLQALIDAQTQPQPAVGIVARTPSSESPTQAPEAPAEADAPSLADSVRALLDLLRSHRTVGDSDVDAAVTAVESALPQD